MALTKSNVTVNNIQGLADAPTLTSTQIKVLFDKTGADLKTFIDGTLTEEIDAKFADYSEVDNTSDADKPVSTATTLVLASKVGTDNPVVNSRLFYYRDVATADDTPSELYLNGVSSMHPISANSALKYKAYLLARKSNGQTESFNAEGTITKGTTHSSIGQVGEVQFQYLDSTIARATGTSQIVGDDETGNLTVTVVGIPATSIRWKCWIDFIEIFEA